MKRKCIRAAAVLCIISCLLTVPVGAAEASALPEKEPVQAVSDFISADGAALTSGGVPNAMLQGALQAQLAVRLAVGEPDVPEPEPEPVHTEPEPEPEPEEPLVRTMMIEATVLYATSVYSDSSLTQWIANLSAGTVVTYHDYRSNKPTHILLADGRWGWVRGSSLQPSTKDFVQYTDYSVTQKERFVNEQGKYSSQTSYLVWISRLTQKVNVFLGSQGKWRLCKTFACCSGKNATPTTSGVFRYYSRTGSWDFGSYYVKNPMLFNGGHAFHTRTYVKSTGALLDPTIGTPKSHGCVRMYDADVNWLWSYMPMGTTVVVW